MPINDPKTPFHEEDDDEQMDQEEDQDDQVDPETDEFLRQAQANRAANAITTSGVQRSEQPGAGAQQSA